jgi:sugar O-acyltransferase (sialic acid O-acetyltransferase NeuD family)
MNTERPFIFWGSGGHAKVLAEVISFQKGIVVALFDSRSVRSALPKVPVYYGMCGFTDWLDNETETSHIAGLVAIGGHRGRERMEKHNLFRHHGFELPVAIHPSAVISKTSRIGAGSQILALANIAADVITGEACIINNCAYIGHDTTVGNGVHVGPSATVLGCSNLGDYCFIGAGAVVLPRLNVGQDSVIGAGAVVTRDIPPGTTVVGNPARPIKH